MLQLEHAKLVGKLRAELAADAADLEAHAAARAAAAAEEATLRLRDEVAQEQERAGDHVRRLVTAHEQVDFGTDEEVASVIVFMACRSSQHDVGLLLDCAWARSTSRCGRVHLRDSASCWCETLNMLEQAALHQSSCRQGLLYVEIENCD